MAREKVCLVWEMRHDGRLPKPGKHEAHPPHVWYLTEWGGGHQLDEEPVLGDPDYPRYTEFYCPGRSD